MIQAKNELPAVVDGTYYFDNEPGSFWRILRGTPGVDSAFPDFPTPRPFARADTVVGGIEVEIDFGRPVRIVSVAFWHRARSNQQMQHYARFYADDDSEIGAGGGWSGSSGFYGWYRTVAGGQIENVRRVRFFYVQHTDADLTAEVAVQAYSG